MHSAYTKLPDRSSLKNKLDSLLSILPPKEFSFEDVRAQKGILITFSARFSALKACLNQLSKSKLKALPIYIFGKKENVFDISNFRSLNKLEYISLEKDASFCRETLPKNLDIDTAIVLFNNTYGSGYQNILSPLASLNLPNCYAYNTKGQLFYLDFKNAQAWRAALYELENLSDNFWEKL